MEKNIDDGGELFKPVVRGTEWKEFRATTTGILQLIPFHSFFKIKEWSNYVKNSLYFPPITDLM